MVTGGGGKERGFISVGCQKPWPSVLFPLDFSLPPKLPPSGGGYRCPQRNRERDTQRQGETDIEKQKKKHRRGEKPEGDEREKRGP